MKQDNINYLAVGMFVLTMIALLIVTLARITGGTDDTETYFVQFSNISDINKGSAVTFGGFQIGFVEDIIPERESGKTRFRLQLAVRRGWPIPADSLARIMAPGLLADNQIDITEGTETHHLNPGDTIKDEAATGVIAVLDKMSSEISDLSENNIKPLLRNINSHIDIIASDLTTHIPEITENVNTVLVQFNENATRLSQLLNSKNQQHIANLLANADLASQDVSTLIHGFNESNTLLNQVLNRSDNLISENRDDIRSAIVNLRVSLEVVAQNIDAIVFNLESASRNTNEFTRQIRENPSVLLSGSPPPNKDAAR